MEKKLNHPGIYIPPPLVYLAVFLLSLLLQHLLPLSKSFFSSRIVNVMGLFFALAGFCLGLPAIIQFFRTGNTVVTVKPASSLQTTGIYTWSRNPMYLCLLLLYLGAGLVFGNWWTLIFLFPLIVIVQVYLIRREEIYLEHTFGQAYLDYKKKVRRWL